MIGYLEGTLLKKEEDRILLLVNQIGYEVLLPSVVMSTLNTREIGETISLYIYYHQTERQPKPVLIGFNLENEKEFFQHFISVEAVGPLKAMQALSIPFSEIADAIENKDAAKLTQLKGIGSRTAQKIIATLEGKLEKFAQPHAKLNIAELPPDDITQPILDVLVKQLGHRHTDAKQMIAEAVKRKKSITTPEELFDEIYREGKKP